jgi:chromatin segregation and condensation protein Rec8/ScpA/Scc1 (kleisin family)
LLELVKRQRIQARQDEECAEILLFPRRGPATELDEAP